MSACSGAVTFVQRFGGLVNLNVHFHLVVPDGVFVDDEAHGLRFELLPVPTNAAVLAILDRLVRRIARRLARLANADAFDDDSRPDVLAQVQADAATTWRSSADARATVRGVERLRAWCEGFSLHAGVVVAAHDRAALERLCRYGARPAFAQERLAWTADGRIAYKLKRPWPDGRTHLVMEPVAFLRRLVGIIPAPAPTSRQVQRRVRTCEQAAREAARARPHGPHTGGRGPLRGAAASCEFRVTRASRSCLGPRGWMRAAR